MFDARKPYIVKNMIVQKLETKENTGFLQISVFSEDNRKPISNAKVTIYLYEKRGIYEEAATENEIVSYSTDELGKVPIIELPVIHELNNAEENKDEYHMKVEAPGYYTVIVMNMEVFHDITTDFNVVLTPISTGETHTEFIIIPEKH